MRATRGVMLVAALLGGACGGKAAPAGAGTTVTGTDGAAASVDGAGSNAVWNQPWDAVVQITDTDTQMPDVCDTFSFTLAFPTVDGGPQVVASAGGYTYVLVLDRNSDGSLQAPPTQVNALPNGVCTRSSLRIFDLKLRVVGGKLTGTATGTSHYDPMSDYGVTDKNIALSFSGKPDATAPTLKVPSGALSPTDYVGCDLSEVLASADLALSGNGSALAIPLTVAPLTVDGPASGGPAHLGTDQVLPFAGIWSISGSAADFAGHALVLGQKIYTLPDPGIFVTDGFESTFNATLDPGAVVIADSGAIKPITGQHSLRIEAGNRVLLHLQRSAAQTTLAFNAVVLNPEFVNYGANEYGGIAAVIGGTQRVSFSWPVTGSTATGDAMYRTVSDVAAIKVPLSDSGSDVVVSFAPPSAATGPYGPNGPRFGSASLLIDDVRLE